MGSGYMKKCPQCGFRFSASNGVGFMFPKVYAETVQKAKEGELGNEIQAFFTEHGDGAINAERVTLCCKECGYLSNDADLTMYVPKNNKPEKIEHGRWSVSLPFENASYVSRMDLGQYYTEYAKYPHKCGKCGGTMRIVEDDEEIVCPQCKIPLETEETILWD